MYYLINYIDREKFELCLNTYIFKNKQIRESDIVEVHNRIMMTFSNDMFRRKIQTSDKKWIDENIEDIFDGILKFLISLNND